MVSTAALVSAVSLTAHSIHGSPGNQEVLPAADAGVKRMSFHSARQAQSLRSVLSAIDGDGGQETQVPEVTAIQKLLSPASRPRLQDDWPLPTPGDPGSNNARVSERKSG